MYMMFEDGGHSRLSKVLGIVVVPTYDVPSFCVQEVVIDHVRGVGKQLIVVPYTSPRCQPDPFSCSMGARTSHV